MAKKKAVISLLATMALSTAAGVVALNVNTGVDSISANAATTSLITFKESAAIRLSTTDTDTGIRYTAYLDESLLNVDETVSFKDVTVGMLIVPSKVLDGLTDDYIDELVNGYNKPEASFTTTFEDWQIQSETVEGVTKYYVCGAINEITDVNYNEAFRAVAYYKDANETVNYSAQSDACTIAYVADTALVELSDGLTDGAKAMLGGMLEKSVTLATQDVEISCFVGGTVDLSGYFDEITGATYAVTAGDATVDQNGVVTLNAAETATITVTAHGGYVNVPVNVTVKEATKLTSANVSETEIVTAIANAGTSATIANQATSFTLDMSDKASEIAGTLKSVTVGDRTYTEDVSYADGKITVNDSDLLSVYGEKNYTAYFEGDNEKIEVSGKTLFVTMEIESSDEFNSFVAIGANLFAEENATNSTRLYSGYFTLGSNITSNGYNLTENFGTTAFSGTFDGRGYAIDGFSTSYVGMFDKLTTGAIVRNIAFVNTTNNQNQYSGLIARSVLNWNDTFTIENIYIHYNTFKGCCTSGAYSSILMDGHRWNDVARVSGNFNNIVICADKFESSIGSTTVIGHAKTNAGLIQNVYSYGLGTTTITNKGTASDDKDVYGAYTDKAAMIAANNDYSAFTATDFWTLDSDGVPYPTKLAQDYSIVKFVADETTVNRQLLKNGAEYTLPADPEKSDHAFAGWGLNGATTAYDFDANGKVVTADMTFTALWEASVESANVSENEIVTAIANAGKTATVATQASSYTIDVSDVMPAGELTSLMVGSNTYGLNDFNYENGVITVNQGMAISVYGLQNYTAKFVGDGATTVVSGKVLFVTMEITTVDEFNSMGAIGNAVYQANGGATAGWYQGYFTLGANISYNGTYANYAGEDNTVFSGTFDGRGYTIDGVTTAAGGMFGKVTGDVVIKNFALTNATNVKEANFCGLFTKHFEGTASLTFENIYIHMKTLYIHGATFQTGILGCADYVWGDAAASTGMTCTNIIVTVDETNGVITEGTGKKTYVVGTASPTASTLTNVYTYNTGSLTVVNGTTTGSVGTYTDKATFNDTITAETAKTFTDTGYWTYDATNGLAFVVKA